MYPYENYKYSDNTWHNLFRVYRIVGQSIVTVNMHIKYKVQYIYFKWKIICINSLLEKTIKRLIDHTVKNQLMKITIT